MFMKEIRKYYQRRIIVIAVIIFLSIMFGLPLILHIPFIKQAVSWLLSFTENEAFKAAYVEFFGAIIGSFIAPTVLFVSFLYCVANASATIALSLQSSNLVGVP